MAREDFRFLHDFRVRYSEIDAQGVVFNAHYLTYYDTAINEYFRSLGFDYQGYVDRTGADFHLVKSEVIYEKPIRFDAEIEVGVRTAKIGNTSITFVLEIFGKGNTERYACGEIVWVHTDQRRHQTTPVSEEIRRMIGDFDLKT